MTDDTAIVRQILEAWSNARPQLMPLHGPVEVLAWATRVTAPILARVREEAALDALAEQQGVAPVRDIDEFLGAGRHLFESDEDFDRWMQTIKEGRDGSLSDRERRLEEALRALCDAVVTVKGHDGMGILRAARKLLKEKINE